MSYFLNKPFVLANTKHICSNDITYQFSFSSVVTFSTKSIPNQNLSISLSTTSKIENPLVVDHLINTYGVPSDRAVSASKFISNSVSLSSLQSLPDYLKQCGFTDTQIQSIISRKPELLAYNVDKSIKPKLKFFEELGFVDASLAEFIVKDPKILTHSIDKYLIPNIDFLRSILLTDANVVTAIKRHSWILTSRKNIGRNVDILRKCGVPDEKITRLLLQQPILLTLNQEKFKDIVARVDGFGVKRDSGLFIRAVRVMGSISDATVDEKFKSYKNYGWSESEIVSAFKKYPNILLLSEHNLRAKMNFFIEEVGYEPKDIALRPRLLGCSLEKVLKPRNEVLNVLVSKGLLEKKPSLLAVVVMTKDKFLDNYVIEYADKVPDLEHLYNSLQCSDDETKS